MNSAAPIIATESQKFDYVSRKGPNWCDLPTELRSECVKHMDYMTKIHLKCTSRQENSLISNEKRSFDTVQLHYRVHGFPHSHFCAENFGKAEISVEWTDNEGDDMNRRESDGKPKGIDRFWKLLTECTIGRLQIYGRDVAGILEEKSTGISKFSIKKLESHAENPMDSLFFLKNFDENMEGIKIFDVDAKYPFAEFLDIPAVSSCKIVQIELLSCFSHVVLIFKKWLKIDAPTGPKILFSSVSKDIIEKISDDLPEEIKKHIVFKNATELRIRMEDKKKHILMRCEYKKRRPWSTTEFISMVIIPADQENYVSNRDWLQAVIKEDQMLGY